MSNIRNLIVILIIGFLGLNSAWAQQAEIKVIAKIDTLAKGKKVLIRWAPTTAALWKLSNKQTTGYKLEKIRIVKNSAILTTPEKVGNDEIIKIPDFDTLSTNNYEKRNAWYLKFVGGRFKASDMNRELIKGQDSLKVDSLSLNYAAMWQAVYGVSFDLGTFRSDGIIDETDELNKRYNTALAAAENYFEIAKFVGLGFEDANIIKGERYLYRISALATGYTTVVGTVYIGLDDNESITKIPPYEFSVAYVDSVANINWNTSQLKKYYSGYNLYRSINNQPYVKVNKSPLVSLDEDSNINYADSLGIWNNSTKKYSFNLTNTFAYRIQGITPFGDKGPFSEVYSGTVRRILRAYPAITDLAMQENNTDTTKMFAIIKWRFDSTQVALISGFRISYSDSASGVYQNIVTTIPGTTSNSKYVKEITELQVKKTTYFKVTALANTNAGESKESFPSVVTPIDTLAPLPPKIVSIVAIDTIKKGTDSLVIVQVNWQVEQPAKAENKHIIGFRVFRSQFLEEEATQITNVDNIKTLSYRDTIYLSTQSNYTKLNNGVVDPVQSSSNVTYSTNKAVYYQVIAIDTNYNQSKLSAKFKFRRPDKTPLPPAVFSRYEVNEDGIVLSWAEFPVVEMFNDFKDFQLIRATIPDSIKNNKTKILNLKNKDSKLIWYQVAVIPDPSDTTYIDVDVSADSMYAYCMIVRDSSDNASVSNIVVVQYSNTSSYDYSEPSITNFLVTKPTGKTYTKLNWTHTSTKVAEYQLLRGVDEGNLEDWKKVNSTEKELFDEDIKTGSLYKYGVRALYNNTKRSELKRAEILY